MMAIKKTVKIDIIDNQICTFLHC